MRKDNQLYETEVREVNKEKKRIKIHYKGFPEDTDKWRDYGDDLFPFVRLDKVPFFDLEGFYIVSIFSGLQPHYNNFSTDISVRFFIRSTTFIRHDNVIDLIMKITGKVIFKTTFRCPHDTIIRSKDK